MSRSIAAPCRMGFLLAGALLVGACAGHVPQAPSLTPLRPVGKPRPVAFKRLVIGVPSGSAIGEIRTGIFCLPQSPLTWTGGRVDVSTDEFGAILKTQLESAGYQVIGQSESLFEDTSPLDAEYLIGGTIKDMKVNICYVNAGFGNYGNGTGEAFLEVEWQIYSLRSRQVELKTTTQGSVPGTGVGGTGILQPLVQAFGKAAQNLLANPAFRDLVAPTSTKPGPSGLPRISVALAKTSAASGSAAQIIDQARLSVVTVFAGERKGSGFIISRDGYVLTNEHVVGNAKAINVKMLTGREALGEVVRTDRLRDVALVKLEAGEYTPLPLSSSTKVRPGMDVYAIGTPLAEQFGQSVTRGIVSGFRTIQDQRYIQSDVTVNHGNSGGPLLVADGSVIGIAEMGILAGGREEGVQSGIGMNFFIPIEEAVSVLGIRALDKAPRD